MELTHWKNNWGRETQATAPIGRLRPSLALGGGATAVCTHTGGISRDYLIAPVSDLVFEIPDQFDGSLEVSTFRAFLRTQGMIPWAWQFRSETPSRATLLAPDLGRQQGAWAGSAGSSSCSSRGASFQLHLDGIPLLRLFRSAARAIRCCRSLVKPACLPGTAQPSALEISYRNGLHEKKAPLGWASSCPKVSPCE